MSLTLKPNSTVVTLLQGDDLDRVAELLAAVTQAASLTSPSRIGDADPTQDAIRAYDAFMDEASERAVKVELVALPRKRYREMVAAHPARMVPGPDGAEVVHEDDADAGFNTDTLGDDLVPLSFAPGQFGTDFERDEFVDALSDGQFSVLYSAALGLNRGFGPNPKARLSTHLAQTSGETSEPPERLG